MKNAILLLGLVLFSQALLAQNISNHLLGLRLGDADGFGTEISYQAALGSSNRVELDLGWRNGSSWDGFKLTGVYQWVNNLDGNFNWYYGFGGGLGSARYALADSSVNEGGVFAHGAGVIGLEYKFEIPLMISLDLRPEIGILGYHGPLNNPEFDLGLGIRYVF
ncbi:MAG: hypothetical protein RLZZ241_681 [Bacteroidota bacterium]|jgi:hypothetical protein